MQPMLHTLHIYKYIKAKDSGVYTHRISKHGKIHSKQAVGSFPYAVPFLSGVSRSTSQAQLKQG